MTVSSRSRSLVGLAALVALAGCEGPALHYVEPPPTAVTTTLPPDVIAQRDALLAEIDDLETLDVSALETMRALPHGTLPYDPLTAVNLDLVQASAFALDETGLARLERDGMVIREGVRFPTFAYGYQSLYLEDQALFISADSILEAVHRSYDDILMSTEARMLRPELESLLASMREALAGAPGRSFAPELRADLDLYLAVPTALLTGEPARCVAGCSSSEAQALVDLALAHEGEAGVQLFGTARTEDFSQFEPRGHYTESDALGTYFRAMMWLGRVDLRLIETLPDLTQVFRRGQLLAAFGLRTLMNDDAVASWERIDGVIGAFVGEHDAMVLTELDALLAALEITTPEGLATLDDETIAQAIATGGYGHQRISSAIMINGVGQGTMPLSSSFAFLGQRYVVDSHVFSNVVYDRVQHGEQFRMMPATLDVAYAALGNDDAIRFLVPELTQFQYAPDLEAMRVLVDAHGDDYWHEDLYTSWLGALRTLSPHAGAADEGLPALARSEPWNRRILNTQLASWAELRHDTILYAKQSYTDGSACEFPDAYVEPYPAFFDAVVALAQRGEAAMELTGSDSGEIAYFQRLAEIAGTLGDMARSERTGTPFTEAQMAFVNQAVSITEVCGGSEHFVTGWYGDLHFDRSHSAELDPTMADVHTQPTDEAGNTVGRVLHVATGMPRAAIFTFETCEGPRAYVGLVSSYFERITEDYDRLSDDEWSAELTTSGHPADPAFLGDLVLR